MQARDVMVRGVISVGPGIPVQSRPMRWRVTASARSRSLISTRLAPDILNRCGRAVPTPSDKLHVAVRGAGSRRPATVSIHRKHGTVFSEQHLFCSNRGNAILDFAPRLARERGGRIDTARTQRIHPFLLGIAATAIGTNS